LLRGRLYNRAKKAQNDGGKGTPKGTVPQNEDRFLITEVEVPGRMTTAERLAQQHGVGRATIERDGQFAEAVEELKPIIPDLRLDNT
jgi:hypothetical protein